MRTLESGKNLALDMAAHEIAELRKELCAARATPEKFWDALKRQCCSTQPLDPNFAKVKTVVQVRLSDIKAVMGELRK